MTREEKDRFIDKLSEELSTANTVYLADVAELDAEATMKLRRQCHQKQVKLQVVKNTLLRKAMDKVEGKDFTEMYDLLKGNTSVMLSEAGNAPAKLIKNFRKKSEKPVLKGAFIEETIYVGDDQLNMLADLKSKDELVADIIMLLQSPAKNVISSLQSGKNTLSGLLKALEEREN